MIRYLGTWEAVVQNGRIQLPERLCHGDETMYCRKVMVGGKSGMAVSQAVEEILDAATGPVHTVELRAGLLPIPARFAALAGETAHVLGVGGYMEIFFDGLPGQLEQTFAADLHMHPLDHRYYGGRGELSGVKLHERDKRAIREVVDWCVRERGLDILSLTDHDMLQASLYARDYAREAGLPVRIVTGAECEVVDPAGTAPMRIVHLLCLNLPALPRYSWQTTVPELIHMVKAEGGTVIMSHPVRYPESFRRYAHLLDGYEYRNGRNRPFEEGREHVRKYDLPAKAFSNSDFHYSGDGFPVETDGLQQNHLPLGWLPMLGIDID